MKEKNEWEREKINLNECQTIIVLTNQFTQCHAKLIITVDIFYMQNCYLYCNVLFNYLSYFKKAFLFHFYALSIDEIKKTFILEKLLTISWPCWAIFC